MKKIVFIISILTFIGFGVKVDAQITTLRELVRMCNYNEIALQKILTVKGFYPYGNVYSKELGVTTKVWIKGNLQKQQAEEGLGYFLLPNKSMAIIYVAERMRTLDMVGDGMEEFRFKMQGKKGEYSDVQISKNVTHTMITTFTEQGSMRVIIFISSAIKHLPILKTK